ncbi:MAG: peptidoglycan-binding protein [Acidobacteriia bacterium]|nr:peptidoglycan-binding protein [Terriglobia bacterium]
MSVQPLKLEVAKLVEIWWPKTGGPNLTGPKGQPGKSFTVQFNPQTLKVNFSNQKAGGDQPKGSSTQFVGKGVTKLTIELWFDVTLALAQGRLSGDEDVRRLTSEVAYFMKPQEVAGKKDIFVPPGVRFSWGTFIFDGVMDSMDETLDLFSATGSPIRASVNVSISKQEIIYDPAKSAALGDAPGVQPFEVMKAGEPLQQSAAKAGNDDWKSVALANGIENPRMLAAGALVNLSAGVSVSGAAQLGVDISGGVGVTGGFSAGAGVGGSVSASVGAGIGGSAQPGVSVGAGSQLGFVSGGSVSGGGTISAGAGGSLDASFTASGGFGGGV